jgi:superfamily II DNA/RNA helicase
MPKLNKEQPEIADNKTHKPFLNKFDIHALNAMQVEAGKKIRANSDVVLLSPTGTGKTLAFLLPLIERLDKKSVEIQLLILVPSRELAQQIEQVAHKIGSGFKVNAVYGGRSGMQDKIDLKHRPAILIGTPGRIADRFRRDKFSLGNIHTIVLDEFDKSLEIGFEKEMQEILQSLPNVKQRILTSATYDVQIPQFVGLQKPVFVNYLQEEGSHLTVKAIVSPEKDKLQALKKALEYIGHEPGIVFCNFKDALERVSDFLTDHDIRHESFHGGMEQIDRERALIKFRNGTSQLLLATDLAARGLDIPEIKFILHYHIPLTDKEFTHRNGRTARMNRDGIAYVLHWNEEPLPDFIQENVTESLDVDELHPLASTSTAKWKTLYISGGRRDKISKGDVAGLLLKQGQIQKEQLGVIEVKQDCTYVGVHDVISEKLVEKTNNSKLKTKKVRISVV